MLSPVCRATAHEHIRSEVSHCGGCVSTGGCGYCLSTLRCVEGSSLGPVDGSPCPNWLFETPSHCPIVPQCDAHPDCGSCAAVEDCAWCASDSKCMTVTEIFNQDCRATVFDPPCPTSFVEDKQVVGNLAVVADPMFGGGEFSASDLSGKYRLAITKDELEARSAGNAGGSVWSRLPAPPPSGLLRCSAWLACPLP